MLIRVEVHIGTMVFNAVNFVECHKSIKNFTGTAKVKLPKKLRFRSNGKTTSMYAPDKTVKDYIKVGDPVTIFMGYDQHLIKRFEGYISKDVEIAMPLVLRCEDEMWKLKQKEVSVSIRNATIKQIINTIVPEYKTDVLDAEIGNFSMKNTTATKVLQELKKRYGLYSYFIGKTLIVGKPYTNNTVSNLPTKTYEVGHNVIDSDLKNVNPNDYKIKIKAISINPDNTKIEVVAGDKNGAIRTLHFFDKSKKELQRLVKENINKFKRKGLEGSITGFGFPIVEIGQKLRFVDNFLEKRDSVHYADEVTEWIDRGYRRKVIIGQKANQNE